jgi:DSF synthase
MTYIQKLAATSAAVTERTGTPGIAVDAISHLPIEVTVANTWFEHIDVSLEADSKTYWAFMRASNRPNFTLGLLRDMQEMQVSIRDLFDESRLGKEAPVKFFVFGSKIPGIYNLGGDLGHFVERIRAGDIESMRHYAYECINVIYGNAHAFHLPIVTIGLVQGDALGGGLECALSYDILVAERSAKLGLPEVLFNLFPGMGAYSFLSRRLGAREAEKMIMSGRVYSAAELHDMGVVDVLAEDGEGEMAVRDTIARNARKHNAHTAMYQARRRVQPLHYEELKDIVDIWVDAALRLTEADLRKMTHLTAAQNRRLANLPQAASV